MFMPALLGFLKDRRGAFAMQFALMVTPLVICTGVAIDGGRIFLAKAALRSATDNAALAAGSNFGTTAQQNAMVDTFTARNFELGGATLVRPVTPVITAQNITVTASADVETFFMPIVGREVVRVSATSVVRRASSGLMVSLVLDNTGSMWSGDNIGGLRNAASSLTTALFDGNPNNPWLRVAIVPYASAVNPGAAAETIVASHAYGMRNPADKTKWKGCVTERSGANSIADTPSSTAQWGVFWYPSGVDNFYDITNASTITPGGTVNSNGVTGPNIGCPTEILPLTNSKAAVDASIAGMTAWNRGGTLTDIGVAWGLRTLSPGEPFTQSQEIDPVDNLSLWASNRWRKAMVIMTDGESQFFNLGGTATPNAAHPSASDYTGYQRLDDPLASGIFGTTNTGTVNSALNTRIASLCTTAKSQGIIVYTVVFTSGVSQGVRDMYQACASHPSKYWYAPDQTALNESFEQIGEDLSRLRLAQ
jgi:Flp pilus assembly protein TadG